VGKLLDVDVGGASGAIRLQSGKQELFPRLAPTTQDFDQKPLVTTEKLFLSIVAGRRRGDQTLLQHVIRKISDAGAAP
jgi:hypothetical protein